MQREDAQSKAKIICFKKNGYLDHRMIEKVSSVETQPEDSGRAN